MDFDLALTAEFVRRRIFGATLYGAARCNAKAFTENHGSRNMTSTGLAVTGHYDVVLVALSVFLAIGASYAALDLATRVTSAQGKTRLLWLSGGAIAMGTGIWSMHYVGMLAYRLPVPVEYDWPTVLISLLAAMFASLVALHVASGESMSPRQALVGSLLMGGGIAGMHYIGMAAMRVRAECHYSYKLVSLSVLLAFAISYVALRLTFHAGGRVVSSTRRKFPSALLMGAAIPVMHYTGMAAASFTSSNSVHGSLSHSLSVSSLGIAMVIIVSVLVLAFSIVTSVAARRLSAQRVELEASEARCNQILESALDAFVATDANGCVTDWNSQAERAFGWLRSEATGRLLCGLIFPGRYQGHEADMLRFLASTEGSALNNRIETTATRKDGREFPVELTVSKIGEGQQEVFAAFVRDIAERKRWEKLLTDAKDAAEQSNQAKSDFLANMSHEIRTPMNGIIGMTDLALETELTHEQREYLGMVKSSANSLLSLLNDILDFSKIEAGKLDFEAINFQLRDTIDDTLKSFGLQAQRKGLEMACHIAAEVPDGLVGDPTRIRQILVNLVSNAIKFTAEGEIAIHVGVENESDNQATLTFAVKDSGVGIPEEKQLTIFEAFTQADTSMTRKFGGTGLGLAISSRLVNMMGGTMWVESEIGTGSVFHFTLQLQTQKNRPRNMSPWE